MGPEAGSLKDNNESATVQVDGKEGVSAMPAGKAAAKGRRAADAAGEGAEAKRGRCCAPVVEVEDDAMLEAESGGGDPPWQEAGARLRRSRRLEEREFAAGLQGPKPRQ